MKSHELATALTALARILKAAPNVELSELSFNETIRSIRTPQDLAVNLSTLVSLSRVNRSMWTDFVRENGFPIELRARDGSRDVLDKLLKYLESNPEAQKRLKANASRIGSTGSPELMKALATLLKD